MLGLYLYPPKIGHKSCNMLHIQNKLLLKKKLQNFVTNNVLDIKSKYTNQHNKKSNVKTLARAGN